jgi:DNA modification methylase
VTGERDDDGDFDTTPSTAQRTRRSLTHVGGDITRGGDQEGSLALAHALEVAPAGDLEEEPERADVHGFHVYPARMHPTTASRLVQAFAAKGSLVLDPFCGSGTVLVEAVAAGRRATGTDLNPLAVRLAKLKVRDFSEQDRELLLREAEKVRAFADTRRKAKAGATMRYPEADVELFEPHVLLELDSLRAAIAKADPSARDPLELVLSSLLVKVSRKRGDTSTQTETRRLAAGYTAKLFFRKTEELVTRLAAFAERCPSPRPRARVVIDDATELAKIDSCSVDTIVTSPPYVATYDYAEHHETRSRWLGLRTERFHYGEFGSRRAYASLDPDQARDAWLGELVKMLRAFARVVRPGGKIVLLMADSAVAGEALRADDLVAEASEHVPALQCEARASQARPHFHGPTASAFRNEPRREHALLLGRPKTTSRASKGGGPGL